MSITRPADLTAAAPIGLMADKGVCDRRVGPEVAERCVAGVAVRFIFLELSLMGSYAPWWVATQGVRRLSVAQPTLLISSFDDAPVVAQLERAQW
jgi:hypothetical protein